MAPPSSVSTPAKTEAPAPDERPSSHRTGKKILYITQFDPTSLRSNSGTHRFISETILREGHDIVYLMPGPILRLLDRLAVKIYRLFYGTYVSYRNSLLNSLIYGLGLSVRARFVDHDVVFVSRASNILAFLSVKKPVIYTSDLTYSLISQSYREFRALSRQQKCEGNIVERRALKNAQAVIFPSRWAKASAVTDYEVDPGAVYVLPSGANMAAPPSEQSKVYETKVASLQDTRFLFVGREWGRKGGDLVHQTLLNLRGQGRNVHLTVVGLNPPIAVDRSWMTVIPDIDKDKPEGLALYVQLLNQAHFLFVPSEAEAYGLVFVEAFSRGVPVITKKEGGIQDIVDDEENGLFVDGMSIEAVAQSIGAVVANPNRYLNMCNAAEGKYRRKLNWDIWGRDFTQILNAHVPAGAA